MKAALLFSLPGKSPSLTIPTDTPISRLLPADRLLRGHPTHPLVAALVFPPPFPLRSHSLTSWCGCTALGAPGAVAGGSDVAPLLVAQAAASAKREDGPVSPAVLLAVSPKQW